jgi:hypothetical protein
MACFGCLWLWLCFGFVALLWWLLASAWLCFAGFGFGLAWLGFGFCLAFGFGFALALLLCFGGLWLWLCFGFVALLWWLLALVALAGFVCQAFLSMTKSCSVTNWLKSLVWHDL